MHGNVFQWCQDWYGPYEKLDSTRDAIQLTKQSDNYRVLRGGSWDTYPGEVRSARSSAATADDRDFRIGFRLARALAP